MNGLGAHIQRQLICGSGHGVNPGDLPGVSSIGSVWSVRVEWGEEKVLPSETEEPVPGTQPDEEQTPLALTPEQEACLREIGDLRAMPLESFATVLRFENASDLLACLRTCPLNEHQWAFRGHEKADWPVEPTVERLKKEYPKSFRNDAEDYVRKAFKRRAHHYLQHLPGDRDELEWLALMRHHGAPTRLLDWTKSPYVAAFFAVAEAKEGTTSAIWAIDIDAVKGEAVRLLVQSGVIDDPKGAEFSFSEPSVFERVLLQETNPSIIAPVQPLKMNERATSQQSLFLCPNSLMFGFEFALKQVLKSDRDRVKAWCLEDHPEEEPLRLERLFKLYVEPQARNELLQELHRMNVNYATLFPGLDGFARSLGTNVTVSAFKYLLGGDDVDSIV